MSAQIRHRSARSQGSHSALPKTPPRWKRHPASLRNFDWHITWETRSLTWTTNFSHCKRTQESGLNWGKPTNQETDPPAKEHDVWSNQQPVAKTVHWACWIITDGSKKPNKMPHLWTMGKHLGRWYLYWSSVAATTTASASVSASWEISGHRPNFMSLVQYRRNKWITNTNKTHVLRWKICFACLITSKGRRSFADSDCSVKSWLGVCRLTSDVWHLTTD